jgi:hypothetical protein
MTPARSEVAAAAIAIVAAVASTIAAPRLKYISLLTVIPMPTS